MRRHLPWLLAATLVALPACGDDDQVSVDSGPTTTIVATTVPTTATTAPTTTTTVVTVAPTAPPTATPAPTAAPTSPAPTTGTGCEPFGSTDEVRGGPIPPSGAPAPLVGSDIRTGAQACFERIVIELTGDTGFPAYQVGYTDRLVLGESDETVDLAGAASLEIVVSTWMTYDPSSPTGEAYTGPTDFVPANVEAIEQVRLVGDDEGVMRWGVGLDEQRPFRVQVLKNPARLVVDVSVP